jgi:rhamnosyltransferase
VPEDHVCAVIVTYHPNAKNLENIPKVLAQVHGLVVVDNGSHTEHLTPLREMVQAYRFKLIENAENLGIAEALNQGVLWAKAEGYHWVILFDQDSSVTDCLVEHMMLSWREHPQRDRVVILQPRYINPSSGYEASFERAKDGGPVFSMTSGSLLPTRLFDLIGRFASEYFIDYVDIEYCLRARAAGYLIAESRNAVLLHAPGEPKTLRLFGVFPFRTSNHSAARRYYLIRNRVATARKYFRVFPLWTVNDLMYTGREVAKIVLGEKHRREKLAAMLKGFVDGIAGRMGKLHSS